MTPARELRFTFVFHDYDAALHLFRDVFGLETVLDIDHEGGRGVILKVPSATLEVFDRAQGAMWTMSRWADASANGYGSQSRSRISLRPPQKSKRAGASPVADPVVTPWGDHTALLHERWPPADPLPETQLRCVTARPTTGTEDGPGLCRHGEQVGNAEQAHGIFERAFARETACHVGMLCG
jgi:catechol 2,3-dioxygenase-like lactoylglutathione lyase family enzyme